MEKEPLKNIFIVADSHTFGIITPNQPNHIQIISASIIKGATTLDGFMPTSMYNNLRLAKLADFDDFRVSTKGYETDDSYNFPKE